MGGVGERTCRVFGHGSGAVGDELNGRASFERVRALGCDGVELDVRRTRDDALAVIHDPVLPDGRDVSETSSTELPEDVLLLAEVLDLLHGRIVNVEVKNFRRDPHWDPEQRVTDLLIELLLARGRADSVIVSCFGPECLERVQRRSPAIPTALLFLSRRPAGELLDDAVARGQRIVHPYDTMVDAGFMREARERELAVHVWTAEDDSERRLAELIQLGVDGLITGAPEIALRLLQAPSR